MRVDDARLFQKIRFKTKTFENYMDALLNSKLEIFGDFTTCHFC